MSKPSDPKLPAPAWADTQRAWPRTELGLPATQIVGDREAYLGRGSGHLGRHVVGDQWELFVSGEVAGALQREFIANGQPFVALHDLGGSTSLRLLGNLASACGQRVQRLAIRREGHGVALMMLPFVELPLSAGRVLRLYSTDISGDTPERQPLAQVMLGFSRLGVLLVGDLPANAVSTVLHPLHERMLRGPWPNGKLLLVPTSGTATLAQQGLELSAGTAVTVQVAPRTAKPRPLWSLIAGAWNQLQSPAEELLLSTELEAAALKPAVPAEPAAAPPQACAPAAPTRHLAPHELPPGFAAKPSGPARPAAAAAAMPVPGGTRWQDYADRCLAAPGVLSVCVFDTHSLQPLAHAGGLPSGARLAQQGALLLAEMVDVARALGFGSTRPDAFISLGSHHLLLLQLAGHPGIAVHLVLQGDAKDRAALQLHIEQILLPR